MNQKTKITYWIATGFLLLVCLGSGVTNVMQIDAIKQVYVENQLPLYLAPFLGILKILGGVTIVIPALKRFHEGAYAGLFFYFIGATYVIIASGGGVEKYMVTVVIFIAVIASYFTSLKK